MTMRLLLAWRDAHVSVGIRLALLVPLLLALLVVVPASLVVAILKSTTEGQTLARDVARCTGAGHPVELHGDWRCPACQLVRRGHAFAPCSSCGLRAAAITCSCGFPAHNPLWNAEIDG